VTSQYAQEKMAVAVNDGARMESGSFSGHETETQSSASLSLEDRARRSSRFLGALGGAPTEGQADRSPSSLSILDAQD